MSVPMAFALHERRHEARNVAFVKPCPPDWVPMRSRCHENAAAWVERFPTWNVVRGWLLVIEDDVLGTMFDAHSVVRGPDGRIWDVTQDEVHRFLVHPGDDVEFMKLVKAGPWVRLSYIPGFDTLDGSA